MLLLFETAAGYALFKVLNEGKLQEAEVSTQSSVMLQVLGLRRFETVASVIVQVTLT